jgi:hypothetical protein
MRPVVLMVRQVAEIFKSRRNVSCEGIPLLGKGGVAAPLIKCREASLAGADGVGRSSHRLVGSSTNHPVRSFKGSFASFLLLSHPPLLNQGGDLLNSTVLRQPRLARILRFDGRL